MGVRSLSWLAVLLPMAWSVAGCGSDPGDTESLISDLAQRAEAAGFESQAEVLRTGQVTEDDLLEATLSARECVRALGIDVSPIVRNFRGELSYSFDTAGVSDVDETVLAADECQDRHQALVAQAFSRLNPDPGDFGVKQVERCMTGKGDDLPPEIVSFEGLLEATQLEEEDSTLVVCFREFVATSTVVVE